MPLEDIVAGVPLFEGLTPGQIRALSAIAQERSYDRDEMIFSEGEPAAGLYIVSAGRVKIFKLSPDGKEQILHLFGPGEMFGEVPVFVGQAFFPAYALALQKSKALFFPRAALVNVIRENPDLALALLAVLSRRLRQFAHLIEDLSLKEVPGRLAAYLLLLSGRNSNADRFDLDVTKTQLASLLGTIPETLSRILARMNRQDLIDLEGRAIQILDREGLEDLASGAVRLTD